MRSGFTLIELVIAMLFGSIILTVLFNSFFVITRVSSRVDTTVGQDLRIALLQNQLEKDLVSAFIPVQALPDKKDASNQKQEAEKKEAAQKEEKEKKDAAVKKQAEEQKPIKPLENPFVSTQDADRLKVLSFITHNILPLYEKEKGVTAKPRVMRVAYRLVPEKERKDSFSLMRQESNNLDYAAFDAKAANTIKMYPIAAGIKSIKIKYQVEKKQSEQDKKEKKNKEFVTVAFWPDKQLKEQVIELLPQWAEIDVLLWDDKYQDEKSYQFHVPIGIRE